MEECVCGLRCYPGERPCHERCICLKTYPSFGKPCHERCICGLMYDSRSSEHRCPCGEIYHFGERSSFIIEIQIEST
jgi:hypothetical protein